MLKPLRLCSQAVRTHPIQLRLKRRTNPPLRRRKFQRVSLFPESPCPQITSSGSPASRSSVLLASSSFYYPPELVPKPRSRSPIRWTETKKEEDKSNPRARKSAEPDDLIREQ